MQTNTKEFVEMITHKDVRLSPVKSINLWYKNCF